MSSWNTQEPQAAIPALPQCCQGAGRCKHPGPRLPHPQPIAQCPSGREGIFLETVLQERSSKSPKTIPSCGRGSHQGWLLWPRHSPPHGWHHFTHRERAPLHSLLSQETRVKSSACLRLVNRGEAKPLLVLVVRISQTPPVRPV